MSNDERKALYNDGQGREYPPSKCPKCGAEAVEPSALVRALLAEVPAEFACGSHAHDGGQSWHSDACRIRELTAENARLRDDLAQSQQQLAYLWHQTGSCPCGARIESPGTHPHVGGCPTAEAIKRDPLATAPRRKC